MIINQLPQWFYSNYEFCKNVIDRRRDLEMWGNDYYSSGSQPSSRTDRLQDVDQRPSADACTRRWIVISSKNPQRMRLGIYRLRTSRNEDVNKICLICNKLMVFFLWMWDCPDQLVTFVFGISIEDRCDWNDICDLLKNYSVTCPSSTSEMMSTVVFLDVHVIREIKAS